MPRNYPFTPIELPYTYSSLAPEFDPDTVYIHYNNLYKNYIINLNAILERYPQYQSYTLHQLLTEQLLVPQLVQNDILFNAGGIYNHEMYFLNLNPDDTVISGDLLQAINSQYGSVEDFYRIFTEAAMSLRGSGWIWLVTPNYENVNIVITSNHQTPSLNVESPIFTLDMWEHSYFLKYHSDKRGYINAWLNLLDKERVSNSFSVQKELANLSK